MFVDTTLTNCCPSTAYSFLQ